MAGSLCDFGAMLCLSRRSPKCVAEKHAIQDPKTAGSFRRPRKVAEIQNLRQLRGYGHMVSITPKLVHSMLEASGMLMSNITAIQPNEALLRGLISAGYNG